MTFEKFIEACARDREPQASPLLRAMWHDARGNWAEVHRIAQDVEGEQGAWVHAYLHRKEGDPGNAGYWYRRAHRAAADGSLKGEWNAIVAELLRSA